MREVWAVFEKTPGPEGPRFVETETPDGKGVGSPLRWEDYPGSDDLQCLGPFYIPEEGEQAPSKTPLRDHALRAVMLTDAEIRVMAAAEELSKMIAKLPVLTHHDKEAYAVLMHTLMEAVLARPGIRAFLTIDKAPGG